MIIILTKAMTLFRNYILTIFFIGSYSTVFGSEIKGFVYDKNSREQLVEADVTITPGQQKTVTSLDGSFIFTNVKEGTYHLKISFVSYGDFDTTISVNDNSKENFTFYLLPKSTQLSGVTIYKTNNGGSDEFALRKEQNANSIMNIVSSHSIEISPDIMVASVVQRISGVSVERGSSGEGQYVIIRGMDKRYNTMLINGVKIPSPDNRNRYVPVDIFPADLLERIEVIKSLTPDMEADAAGGVINLVMKSASDKFLVAGNVGTGYSQLFFNRDFSSFPTSSVNVKSPLKFWQHGQRQAYI